MARTVADCALLLESIAGPDGIDDRQPHVKWYRPVPYSKEVRQHLETAGPRPLDGLKIGVLEEGFQHPRQDEHVARIVRQSIDKLEKLGAEVRSCYIPEHRDTELAWMCTLPAFAFTQGLVLNSSGRKQLALTGPAALGNGALSQSSFDVLNTAGQNLYLRGLFLQEKYGPALVSRCTNLLRKLSVRIKGYIRGLIADLQPGRL
jgi:amidase